MNFFLFFFNHRACAALLERIPRFHKTIKMEDMITQFGNDNKIDGWGCSKMNLHKGSKFRVSVLYIFHKQQKTEIFRCGRTEGCQHRWHRKVLVWPSLKLDADSILAADAEPLSLVYCNVRYMHGRARCLGWWLLKNRRFKKETKTGLLVTKRVTSAPALVAKCGYGRRHEYSRHKEEVLRENI